MLDDIEIFNSIIIKIKKTQKVVQSLESGSS